MCGLKMGLFSEHRSGYVALLCDFIDKEPSNYEEAAEQKEWKDAMIEEYQSFME